MDRSSWGFGAKGRAGPRRPLWGGEKARRIRSRRRAGRAWGRHRHRCAAGPSSPRIPSASPTAGATPASGKAGAARQAGFWAGPAHLPGAKMMTTKGWRRPPTAAPGPAGGGPCAQAAQFSMTTVPKKQWPLGPLLGEHQQAPCVGRGAVRQAMRASGRSSGTHRPTAVVPAAKGDCPGLPCEPQVEICNVFQGRRALSRWIFQPVARVCGVGLRLAGRLRVRCRSALGGAAAAWHGLSPSEITAREVRFYTGWDSRVLGTGLRRAGWLCAWCEPTLGGADVYSAQDFLGWVAAFLARTLAELGGCILDAGVFRQGSLVLVVNLCWAGRSCAPQARAAVPEAAAWTHVPLNSTDGGCRCPRFWRRLGPSSKREVLL